MKEHIHTPDDGRGRRIVRVDGVEVERAFYADTHRGVVRAYYSPLRISRRGDSVRWRKVCGVVTVELTG